MFWKHVLNQQLLLLFCTSSVMHFNIISSHIMHDYDHLSLTFKLKLKNVIFHFNVPLLAHLSRRLVGELIVYTGIRSPSISPSTFSNNMSSETIRPIRSILHT